MKISTRAWLKDTELIRLLDIYQQASHPCRFVGGCVRDKLLGEPVHDIDIATSALPEHGMQLLDEAGIRVIPTGIKHGTITAFTATRQVEITTLRRDVACDGRHADVAYTDQWEEDAQRRDFTINALYADPNGTVHDYHDGVADLNARRVRFIGQAEKRIEEDALRILRFFRFWSRFSQNAPDEQAMRACATHASRVEQLSGERIQQEMLSLLMTRQVILTLQHMREAKIEPYLWGDTIAIERLQWLLRLASNEGIDFEWDIRTSALLAQSREAVAFTCERWRLSQADRHRLQKLHAHSLSLDASFKACKSLIRQIGNDDFIHATYLLWAEEAESCGTLESPHAPAFRAMIALAQGWSVPTFPVTGQDLKAYGLQEGPQLGRTLKRLERQWEHSDYSLNKAELLKLLD